MSSNNFSHIQESLENAINSQSANRESQLFEKGKDYFKDTKKILANKRYKINTILRIALAIWSALLITSWVLLVACILTNNTEHFKLSDTVIIAFLSTTTIQVIGIIIIAMRDLFPGSKV